MIIAINWDTVFYVVMFLLIVLGIFFIPRGVSSKSRGIHYTMTDEKVRNKILGKKKGK